MAPGSPPGHPTASVGQARQTRAALTALPGMGLQLPWKLLLLFLSPDRPRPAGIPQIQGFRMFSRSVKASETRACSQVTFCSCHGTSGIFQQLRFLQMPLTAALRTIPVTQSGMQGQKSRLKL